MIDLEPYVGELVLLLLSRPMPYVGKSQRAFEPVMVPDPSPPPPQPPGAPPLPQGAVPLITDNFQGRIDKQGGNYTITYTNPFNKATRISVAVEPSCVHAVYSFKEIAIVSPGEVPPLPGQQ